MNERERERRWGFNLGGLKITPDLSLLLNVLGEETLENVTLEKGYQLSSFTEAINHNKTYDHLPLACTIGPASISKTVLSCI